MPVSLIPIVEKAEQKMEELLAGGFDTTDASAPVPKSTVEVPELSTKVSDSINALFSDAGNRIFSHVSKTGSIDASKKFLPSSFPGPCRRTGPAGAAAFAHVGVKRMMTPLIGADGREIKPKKDLSHAYRVATIAGLWQFKGLDKDIDKALNLIWQGTLHARRADQTVLWNATDYHVPHAYSLVDYCEGGAEPSRGQDADALLHE